MHVINYSLLKENNIFRNMEGNVTSSSNRSKWVSPKLPMVSWEHPGASRSTPRLRFGKLPTLIVKCMVPIYKRSLLIHKDMEKEHYLKKESFQFPPSQRYMLCLYCFGKIHQIKSFCVSVFFCWSLPWLQGPHFCGRVDDWPEAVTTRSDAEVRNYSPEATAI